MLSTAVSRTVSVQAGNQCTQNPSGSSPLSTATAGIWSAEECRLQFSTTSFVAGSAPVEKHVIGKTCCHAYVFPACDVKES